MNKKVKYEKRIQEILNSTRFFTVSNSSVRPVSKTENSAVVDLTLNNLENHHNCRSGAFMGSNNLGKVRTTILPGSGGNYDNIPFGNSSKVMTCPQISSIERSMRFK